MLIKAKVAHSECEVDGASDLEALFASREEAKPPNILTTVAGFHKSESGSLRIFGHWNSRQRSAFASFEGVKWPIDSSHCS